MNRALYKSHLTSRGLSYSYFFSPPAPHARTLLLLHGFPSTSHDWHRIVPFLLDHGLGVLAPDMLGFGGTDKPLDTAAYVPSLIVQDIIDVVDAEKLNNVVVVGHDWGSMITSRLANLHATRFAGFAFLALGYLPPAPAFDMAAGNAYAKATVGYEIFGYWQFNSSPGAPALIEQRWDSFLSLLFSATPELIREHFGPSGAFERWLRDDRRAPRAHYLDEKALADISGNLRAGGLAAPLHWYTVRTTGLAAADEKLIPEAAHTISKPAFIGVSQRDDICIAAMQERQAAKYCLDRRVQRYDGDHWIILSHADDIARDLLSWIGGLGAGAQEDSVQL